LPAATAALSILTSVLFAQENNLRVKGAFDGKFTGTVAGTTLEATGGGAGTASVLGPFTYVEKATVDLATGLSNGTIQITAANGDVINASYVGRALPEIPKGSHFVALLTITGGTGRYRNATGGLTLDRLFDDTNIPAFTLGYGTMIGTINTPGSDK
jgi:hypothetical protein